MPVIRRNELQAKLKEAIASEDLDMVEHIIEVLQYGSPRLNYRQMYEFARAVSGISQPDWDALLYQVDVRVKKVR